MERLQKIISKAGLASRREAEKMIVEGRVSVNGKVVTELGTKIDIKKDKVFVDNKKIAIENMVYLILHKPKGIVTTLKDEKGRMTVIDLIKDVPERVYPVGRLDYNTEGLFNSLHDMCKKLDCVRDAIYELNVSREKLVFFGWDFCTDKKNEFIKVVKSVDNLYLSRFELEYIINTVLSRGKFPFFIVFSFSVQYNELYQSFFFKNRIISLILS